jgi:hypothetical protein
MHLLVPFVAALAVAAPFTPAAMLDSPMRHIRTDTPYIRAILKDGLTKSPTFARLASRIERSDVIVQIEVVPRLPSAVEGRMLLLTRTIANRYIRIQIELRGSRQDTIALLGHELWHAGEVANAPDVSTQDELVALYERIGTRVGFKQYETAGARDAGRRVRSELS